MFPLLFSMATTWVMYNAMKVWHLELVGSPPLQLPCPPSLSAESSTSPPNQRIRVAPLRGIHSWIVRHWENENHGKSSQGNVTWRKNVEKRLSN